MGAYCPAPCVTPELFSEIETIVQRTLEGLLKEDRTFVGVLFAGFMLTATGPKLLEYNVRMGDPETQVCYL
jgi:phosphoribosylamine-glycine ligase